DPIAGDGRPRRGVLVGYLEFAVRVQVTGENVGVRLRVVVGDARQVAVVLPDDVLAGDARPDLLEIPLRHAELGRRIGLLGRGAGLRPGQRHDYRGQQAK